jgi:hypothetical protein
MVFGPKPAIIGADALSVNDILRALAALAGDAPPPRWLTEGSNDA